MPQIRVRVDLGKFDIAFSGRSVQVWADAPGDPAFSAKLSAFVQSWRDADGEITAELKQQGAAVYADAWNCTQEEAYSLLWEHGPTFGAWILFQTSNVWRDLTAILNQQTAELRRARTGGTIGTAA